VAASKKASVLMRNIIGIIPSKPHENAAADTLKFAPSISCANPDAHHNILYPSLQNHAPALT
jgi:hypothetical protein